MAQGGQRGERPALVLDEGTERDMQRPENTEGQALWSGGSKVTPEGERTSR